MITSGMCYRVHSLSLSLRETPLRGGGEEGGGIACPITELETYLRRHSVYSGRSVRRVESGIHPRARSD